MKRYLALLSFFFVLAAGAVAHAQGGPPMVTDDPGTPGDKHWEINLAGLFAGTHDQNVLQLPYADINYGVGERIQLKIETGWATEGDTVSWQNSGVETILAGVKYRFLDESKNGISVSTYPQVQFHHEFSSNDPEIAAPGDQYVLPFEFSKTLGAWELNPEIGYLWGTVVTREIFYGLVVAFENAKPFEPLAEVHVNTRLDGSGSTTLINFGARYTINEKMNLLAAVGHTVTQTSDAEPELDAYFGLQLEL